MLKLNRFGLAAVLLASAVWSAPSFNIDKFDAPEACESTDFITGVGPTVRPSDVQPGGFFVRCKVEDPFEDAAYYNLHRGSPTAALGKLKKSVLPGASPMAVVRAKVYLSAGASAEDDIETVYFDGNYLLADEETETLFVKYNGKMTQLKYVNDKPAQVRFATDPEGAAIVVEGTTMGTSPATVEVSGEEVLVSIAKDGYYSAYKTLKPKPGSSSSESVKLTARPTLPDTAAEFATRIKNLKDARDVGALQALGAELDGAIAVWPDKVAANKSEVSKNAPALKKADGESDAAYGKRKAQVEQDLSALQVKLDQEGNRVLNKLAELKAKDLPAAIAAAQAPVAAEPEPEAEDEDEESVADASDEVADEQNDEDAAFDAVTDVFGYGDDIKKYVGYGLLAVTAGTLTMTILEWLYVNKAQDAVDDTQKLLDNEYARIDACRADASSESCGGLPGGPDFKGTKAAEFLQEKLKTNESNLDDHKTYRLIWGISTGVAAVGAGVLLFVPF